MPKPQINVTPLIDVLLVLLIIFMVITPIKPSAFEARIPAEPENDGIVEPHPDTIIVIVGSDRSLRLNQVRLEATIDEPAELIGRIAAIFDARQRNFAFSEPKAGESALQIERTVFIKAPKRLDYGSVAKIVDAVKGAGARPISLQIDDLD